jgi:elongation factor Ts
MGCDSDFAVRTDEFQALVRDTALHIAAVAPSSVEALLAQPFVKDPSLTFGDLLRAASKTLGERVAVTRFIRWATEEEENPPAGTPPRSPALILAFKRGAS